MFSLFDTSGFPARWHCGQWTSTHGWTHIVADAAIFAAYMAIPCVLAFFVLRRRDVPFLPVFWLFAAFILFCGFGHLVEASIFWRPWYRFSGLIKVCTAVVSWATVFALAPIIPRALRLPGLEEVNRRLEKEIAERQRVEQSLQASEIRFRMLVDAAPTAMIMIGRDGRIVLVNRECERLFGYSRDELLGALIEMIVPERSRARHPALRESYQQDPETRRMGAGRDLTAVRKDGSEFPVEIGLNPIRTDQGDFVLSVVVDLTERKRHEDEKQRLNEILECRVQERTIELEHSNAALERSNMELQQFAYIASHDLQSPLRSIAGFTQLLQRRTHGKFDEQAESWLKLIVDATGRMQALISDLLQYSRIETRAEPFEPISMNAAFHDAVGFLEAAIGDSAAKVTADELPTVIGDRMRLVQLFQNLIGNGIKYRGKETPRVHVSVERCDDEWIFSVRDHGIGIDPKHHERIFEIFKRLHTQQQYPGTGIGLAVCRRVVQRHGGRIWVESSPGAGSTFRFTVPVEHPDEQKAST